MGGYQTRESQGQKILKKRVRKALRESKVGRLYSLLRTITIRKKPNDDNGYTKRMHKEKGKYLDDQG